MNSTYCAITKKNHWVQCPYQLSLLFVAVASQYPILRYWHHDLYLTTGRSSEKTVFMKIVANIT
jgi:hypothetical protein